MYVKRDIEEKLLNWIDEREIICIRGPRQCGKTTLLEKIAQELNSKVSKENMHFINFEDDLERLKFEENPIEYIKFFITEKGKNYFLFDEMQYVNDCGKKLKLVFDTFKNIKIFVTGSSSFDLTNMGKYLVGRIIFFDLFPFSFGEFLLSKSKKHHELYKKLRIDLNNLKIKETIFLKDFLSYLNEYLLFGGYPRIVLEKSFEKKKTLLKNLFITYIEKDVVSLYGKEYKDNVTKLIKYFADNVGGLIKYENVASDLGLNSKDIKTILPLLEDSFVIKLVKPFHKKLSTELKKNPKIYFIDTGLRNYLVGNFENVQKDFLYENFVLNQLKDKKINFWRTTAQTEVDFVVDEKIPIEVKSAPRTTHALWSIASQYNFEKVILANPSKSGTLLKNKIELFFIPLPFF
jgi:uncharacterized protein